VVVAGPDWPTGGLVVVDVESVLATAGADVEVELNNDVVLVDRGLLVVDVVRSVDRVSVVEVERGRVTVVWTGTTGT
jgi:hypothetical protein